MTKLVQDKRPDLINVLEAESPKELGLIPAWSYSALKTYETCAYRSYIAKVKKVQEDYGPAAARGTDIHTQADCLLYTSPSPRDRTRSRMPSSA